MIGGLCALGAALSWALASLVFSRYGERFSALQLNVVKGLLALAMFGITAAAMGGAGFPARWSAAALLAASGVVGIAVGDTAYFGALRRVGPRRTLLIGVLAPPIAGLLAWAALREALAWWQWLAIVVTIGGVGWVIAEEEPGAPAAAGRSGVLLALLSAFCQAAGAVMSHAVLAAEASSALGASILRLAAGTAGVLLVLLVHGRGELTALATGLARRSGTLVLAIFIGTYLAIWLQQLALEHTHAAIAQTLMSTSPLFIIPLVMVGGERVSRRSIVGTLIAFGGVALLFARL